MALSDKEHETKEQSSSTASSSAASSDFHSADYSKLIRSAVRSKQSQYTEIVFSNCQSNDSNSNEPEHQSNQLQSNQYSLFNAEDMQLYGLHEQQRDDQHRCVLCKQSFWRHEDYAAHALRLKTHQLNVLRHVIDFKLNFPSHISLLPSLEQSIRDESSAPLRKTKDQKQTTMFSFFKKINKANKRDDENGQNNDHTLRNVSNSNLKTPQSQRKSDNQNELQSDDDDDDDIVILSSNISSSASRKRLRTHDDTKPVDLPSKRRKLTHVQPPQRKIDPKNVLFFGSFSLQYRVHSKNCFRYIRDLRAFQRSQRCQYLVDLAAHSDWFEGDESALLALFVSAVEELACLQANNAFYVECTSQLVECVDVFDPTDEAVFAAHFDYDADDALPFNVARKACLPGVYETVFRVGVKNQAGTCEKELRVSEGLGACLSLLCKQGDMYRDHQLQHAHLQRYQSRHRRLNLSNLLAFSCKYTYAITSADIEQQSAYQLNVQLHPYQVQSVRFMIDEEQSSVGFYRHFYQMSHFESKETDNDDRPFFYYSRAFKQLLINRHPPRKMHGGFLCEEMGLGKTVECLAVIQYNKRQTVSSANKTYTEQRQCFDEKREQMVTRSFVYHNSRSTLVIAPLSLVGQWEKECVDKSKCGLQCRRYYGPDRRGKGVASYVDTDVVFTTYGVLSQENGSDVRKHILHRIDWHRIILDESHYISNGTTLTALHINGLRASNKWLVTGTPFGRQLYDIHNQLKFVGLQKSHMTQLRLKQLNVAIKNECNVDASAVPLLNVLQHMMMRHVKKQKFNGQRMVVMTGMHERVVLIEFAADSEQQAYYDKLYQIATKRYEQCRATNNVGRGSIALLAALLPSRQACSAHVASKKRIDEDLNLALAKSYRIQTMLRDETCDAKQLYEMAVCDAFNLSERECPICYEAPLVQPLQTACRHIFCGECIRSILMEKAECPMCRKPCTEAELKKPPPPPPIVMSAESDSSEPSAVETEEEKEDCKLQSTSNTSKHEMDDDEAMDEAVPDPDLIKFDTKVNFVVNELKKLHADKPNDKSLVFTSFTQSLQCICEALQKEGIGYRTLTGNMSMNKRKKALHEFESDAHVTVFVLTVRSGAVGITLTAANHVFMMEPPFNTALYKQAINRVHRLGQQKQVFVHTLIVKGSIEEKIWNINKDRESNVVKIKNSDSNRMLKQHEITKLFE